MKETFIDLITRGMKASGYGDRSQFIRDAIWEKLAEMGLAQDREMSSAPLRVGKGGVAQVHSGTGHNIFRQQAGAASARSRASKKKKG